MSKQTPEWTSEWSQMARVQTYRYKEQMLWEEEQRQGSISKLINTLGSLEGLPA